MSELKPCPFCGRPGQVAEDYEPATTVGVECTACGAAGGSVYAGAGNKQESTERAIAGWNQRAGEAAERARAVKIIKALERDADCWCSLVASPNEAEHSAACLAARAYLATGKEGEPNDGAVAFRCRWAE